MNHRLPLLIALVVVVGAVGLLATGGAVAQTSNASENATVDPGARLAGVVGMQDAELDGMIDRRAYGLQIAAAQSNDSRAEIVADRFAEIDDRVDRLEQRRDALDRARENGSMGESRYAARMASLSAEIDATRDLANDTNATAAGLPAETLEANGVNVTAIQTLQNRASELSGPEIAAIARQIGGPPSEVGAPAWDGPGGERGPTDDRGSGSDGGQADGPDRTTDTDDRTNMDVQA